MRIKLFVLVLFIVGTLGARPVIIDTDIGQYFDDSWAISVALASPELDIKLILTAAHNATGRAQILCKFLQQVNRTDIKVGIGLSEDNVVGALYGWAEDYNLNSYPGTVYTDGIQAALDIINTSPTPITILAIAPVGNLYKMLALQPSIVSKVDIIAMSGSINECYNGTAGACPEYNIRENIPAAQAFYNAAWDMTITPLDTCANAGQVYQIIREANNSAHVLVQTLLETYVYWSNHSYPNVSSSMLLCDPVAIYLGYSNDGLVNMEELKLIVTNTGDTVVSSEGKLVNTAISWVDGGLQAWQQQLVTRLIKYTGT